MLNAQDSKNNLPNRVLVIAPHADDETLGVGGTISRLSRQGVSVTVAVLTGHGNEFPHPIWPRQVWECVRAEATRAHGLLGVSKTLFREIPAVMVADELVWKINRITSNLVEEVQPDVVFVPFLFDLHKDHRELFHSFSVTWRSTSPVGRRIRSVYMYETLSETHLNVPYVESGFIPNVWIDISETLETKIQALSQFKSQVKEFPNLRSLETIRALATLRGSQMGVAAAEAFVLVRQFI
jgi:LmbE family N-acetylglucosaminyl deacetylase